MISEHVKAGKSSEEPSRVQWMDDGERVIMSVQGMKCGFAERTPTHYDLYVKKFIAKSDDLYVLPGMPLSPLDSVKTALMLAVNVEFVATSIKESKVSALYESEGLHIHATQRMQASSYFFASHQIIMQELEWMGVGMDWMISNRDFLDSLEEETFGGDGDGFLQGLL